VLNNLKLIYFWFWKLKIFVNNNKLLVKLVLKSVYVVITLYKQKKIKIYVAPINLISIYVEVPFTLCPKIERFTFGVPNRTPFGFKWEQTERRFSGDLSLTIWMQQPCHYYVQPSNTLFLSCLQIHIQVLHTESYKLFKKLISTKILKH